MSAHLGSGPMPYVDYLVHGCTCWRLLSIEGSSLIYNTYTMYMYHVLVCLCTYMYR